MHDLVVFSPLRRDPVCQRLQQNLSGLASEEFIAQCRAIWASEAVPVDHVIIGAGPTGLAAAYYLGLWAPKANTMLIESQTRVGGWCRSVVDQGFTFDFVGHIMFSTDPEVLRLYGLLLGQNVHWQNCEAWVYRKAVYTRHPFQASSARFAYPLRGGFQALMDGFLPLIEDKLTLGTDVIGLWPQKRWVRTSDGRTLRYGKLISTMPLPQLVAACAEHAPKVVRDAALGLQHVSVRCVNLGVARAGLTDKHWIHYPEDTVFQRIFVQGNASPYNQPPGAFALTCEISYSPQKPLPAEGQALVDLCIADAKRVGMLREDDTMITSKQVDMPCAYVVYDQARAANVALIRDWLASFDVILAGRYSERQHDNADYAFMAGRSAAEECLPLDPVRCAFADLSVHA